MWVLIYRICIFLMIRGLSLLSKLMLFTIQLIAHGNRVHASFLKVVIKLEVKTFFYLLISLTLITQRCLLRLTWKISLSMVQTLVKKQISPVTFLFLDHSKLNNRTHGLLGLFSYLIISLYSITLILMNIIWTFFQLVLERKVPYQLIQA